MGVQADAMEKADSLIFKPNKSRNTTSGNQKSVKQKPPFPDTDGESLVSNERNKGNGNNWRYDCRKQTT